MFARDVKLFQLESGSLPTSETIREMRCNLQGGDVYIAKKIVPEDQIRKIKSYLSQIGRSSLPNYEKIEAGCPNSHRLNTHDPRAYVQGCFHQFVFYPWNQDVFAFFDLFQQIFHTKNLLNEIPKEKFLGTQPEEGCTSRLAFQFYPKGKGRLNKHRDPVDFHQLVVPLLLLSKKGEDFSTGGGYLERERGEKIWLEEVGEPGDVVYANAQIPHGVEPIDPGSSADWLDFQGRWIAIFAVNKLHGNAKVGNATDLEG